MVIYILRNYKYIRELNDVVNPAAPTFSFLFGFFLLDLEVVYSSIVLPRAEPYRMMMQ